MCTQAWGRIVPLDDGVNLDGFRCGEPDMDL